jgi:hypothetical protein
VSAGVEFPAASVLRHAAAVTDTSEQMALAQRCAR